MSIASNLIKFAQNFLREETPRFHRPRNRIINGSMRFNQRNAGVLDLNGSNGIPVDRFIVFTNSGGTLRTQHFALQTPGGSPYRLRLTVQAAKASLAATDLFGISQVIEGFEVGDAAFGSVFAKPLIVRFGCRSSVAGTFPVSYRNNALNLSYIGSFTIAPGEVNVDVVKKIVVTPSTTGTWAKDNSAGGFLAIGLAIGPTYSGSAGWQSGNILGLTGQTNFMATAGATFDLFDVGLYVDHDGNGIVPPYELPDYAEELRACRRYFRYAPINMRVYNTAAGPSLYAGTVALDPPMRVAPSATGAVAMPGSTYVTGSNMTLIGIAGTGPDYIDFHWQGGSGDCYVFGYATGLNAEF